MVASLKRRVLGDQTYDYYGRTAMRIRELREDKTLSTRELAEMSGVHRHTIFLRLKNEQTGAHPRTIRKLATALGVEPKELRRKEK